MASGELPEDVASDAAANPHCDEHTPKPPDIGENGLSTVLLLSYGDFDYYNSGDLTWNFEYQLACPVNRVGRVELFQVAHHGLAMSNNPVLVHALAPKVAVMCNGPRKGGDPEVLATLRASPGIEDVWQLHRNQRLAADEQPPPARTANWDDPEGGAFIVVHVDPDGQSFTTQIGADGTAERYACWAN